MLEPVQVPDLSNLDAVHAVLKQHFDQLHGGNEGPYERELFQIICRDNETDYNPHDVNLWMATAAQHAEAFTNWQKLIHA